METWELVGRLRGYVAILRDRVSGKTDAVEQTEAAEWLNWCDRYVAERDPSTRGHRHADGEAPGYSELAEFRQRLGFGGRWEGAPVRFFLGVRVDPASARREGNPRSCSTARVKEVVSFDDSLKDLTATGNFKYGPDFVNVSPRAGEAPWYDLTTMRQWAAHAKYDATHGGPGGGILWNGPEGVTYVPRK